ncbi:AraC family transcriptional regulator [Rubrivirga sp. SAORIC476]|uniref:helix-turn-helix domain-containing protein n=1 Tax=Rubrivirga sp. SAORIC476 TaxID=1961794 RepID=UPI0018E92991|nr:AraC family transcriptional regulator [Rubrivirga sp. SAORIC476]
MALAAYCASVTGSIHSVATPSAGLSTVATCVMGASGPAPCQCLTPGGMEEDLASDLGMSTPTFYQRFKDVTGLTPLRFQKEVRLQEARRLLLVGGADAATAGYRVGYNDPSHFSRDYKRPFGEPPMQDVERVRETADAGALD